MARSTITTGLLVALALLASACGSGRDEPDTAARTDGIVRIDATTTTSPVKDPFALPRTTINVNPDPVPAGDPWVADTRHGDILVDDSGKALYLFTRDEPHVSNCVVPCSDTWPVVTPDSASRLLDAPGLRRDAIIRADGTPQLVINGHPMYLFVDDLNRGDTLGHGVGNVWFLIDRRGELVPAPAVKVGSTDDGEVLISPDSFTLYATADDVTPGESSCYAPCSDTWIPAPAEVGIDLSLDRSQFGELVRTDGTPQLTHKGQPLYTYVDDTNPGDANGVALGGQTGWVTVPADTVDPATVEAEAPRYHARNTTLGSVVVDPFGFTLYAFAKDPTGSATCVQACAERFIAADPDIDVDHETIAASHESALRPDGSTQLSIGGRALYRFLGDTLPGETNGHGLGELWFAISPDGLLYP